MSERGTVAADRRRPAPRKRGDVGRGKGTVVRLFDAPGVDDAGVRPPPADRGKLMFAPDVQALFGTKPDGSFRKSVWWVTHNVAPEQKMRLGRDSAWWEADVLAWIDEQAGAGE